MASDEAALAREETAAATGRSGVATTGRREMTDRREEPDPEGEG